MPKFRKKPLVVEAIQWTGDNYDDVMVFTEGNAGNITDLRGDTIVLLTREGKMSCPKGDWIVKEPNPTADRKFYPIKNEIFQKTYDQVPEKCTACGAREPSNLIPAEPHFLCEVCIRNP
jgi:hypothetical protein